MIAAELNQYISETQQPIDEETLRRLTLNVFCPTGEGGGVDPTCTMHGTTANLLKKILKEGLKISDPKAEDKHWGVQVKGQPVGVYVTTSIEKAARWALLKSGKVGGGRDFSDAKLVILKIKVPKGVLRPDPKTTDFYVPQDIPPEWIVGYAKVQYRTWRDEKGFELEPYDWVENSEFFYVAIIDEAHARELPGVKQRKNYECGAAALHSVLEHFGVAEDYGTTLKKVGTDVQGTDAEDMIRYARESGLNASGDDNLTLTWLRDHLPALCSVTMYNGSHWVAVGSVQNEVVRFMDPGVGEMRSMSEDKFEELWRDDAKSYAIAIDDRVDNVYCPNGPGGGVDPSCSSGGIKWFLGHDLSDPDKVRQRKLAVSYQQIDKMVDDLGKQPVSVIDSFAEELGASTKYLKTKSAKVESIRDWVKNIKLSAEQTNFDLKDMGPIANADLSERINSFKDWIEAEIKEVIGGPTDPLWKRCAGTLFEKGMARAYDDVRGNSLLVNAKLKDEFLRNAKKSVAVEKIKVLAERFYSDIQGATRAASLQMARVLTDGLMSGRSREEIAADLENEAIGVGLARALLIVDTEITRAHAEGQLQAMEDLGVKELNAIVEWMNTGLNVCPLCRDLRGMTVLVEHAHGMIPRHPRCKCAWSPARLATKKDLRRGIRMLEKAIEASIDADDGWAFDTVDNYEMLDQIANIYCPNGPGGGSDPGCFKDGARVKGVWTGEGKSVALPVLSPKDILPDDVKKHFWRLYVEARALNVKGRAGKLVNPIAGRERVKALRKEMLAIKAQAKANKKVAKAVAPGPKSLEVAAKMRQDKIERDAKAWAEKLAERVGVKEPPHANPRIRQLQEREARAIKDGRVADAAILRREIDARKRGDTKEAEEIRRERKGLIKARDWRPNNDPAAKAERDAKKLKDEAFAADRAKALGLLPKVAPPPVGEGIPPNASFETVSKILAETEAVAKKEKGGGFMDSYIVTLKNGVKGQWKPREGERSARDNIKKGTYYKREAAVPAIATVIGMGDLVSPTVVRTVEGKIGALKLWVDDAKAAADFFDNRMYDGNKDLARVAALDELISNTDRHQGNWMIKSNERIVLIDHGLTLPTARGQFRSAPHSEARSRKLPIPPEVQDWDEGKIVAALRANDIEEDAITLVKERLKSLKERQAAGLGFDTFKR